MANVYYERLAPCGSLDVVAVAAVPQGASRMSMWVGVQRLDGFRYPLMTQYPIPDHPQTDFWSGQARHFLRGKLERANE